ncbi:Crinkler effector protein 8 [Phytophthora ramorum]|uniref:Crinkler effector protein 8 n=1 Tax=Phytophthora ramorum TaxID=164328 RepID=UPI0030A29FEF|nr:Crinkler effector protein 8 [Phytophthora ramorum]KAH7496071.1 Crinkler effector protein 8 [Phytophthora ramorum]
MRKYMYFSHLRTLHWRIWCFSSVWPLTWEGSVFSVEIDESLSVDHFKITIQEENKTITDPPHTLRIFLAKGADHKWLKSGLEDARKLKIGDTTPAVEALMHEDNELKGRGGLQDALVGSQLIKFTCWWRFLKLHRHLSTRGREGE